MIKNLQALRALAAVAIIFVHLATLLSTFAVGDFGRPAVQLFFVISGFVMVHSTRAKPPSALEFLTNRIARIAPIYWVMTFSVFTLALIAPFLLGATRADPTELIKSLLFIPFVKANGLTEPLLFVGWTLNYEMFFYVLFALGLLAPNYFAGLAVTAGVIILLCLTGFLTHPSGVLAAFYTHPIMLQFLFGMIVALVVEAAPKSAGGALRRGGAVTVVLALLALFFVPYFWPLSPLLVICGMASAIAVGGAVLIERWGWAMRGAVVLAIGDASYILYLSHPYVTQAMQKLVMPLHPSGVVSVGLVVLAVALAIALALVLHPLVERPLFRAARRLLSTRRMESRPA